MTAEGLQDSVLEAGFVAWLLRLLRPGRLPAVQDDDALQNLVRFALREIGEPLLGATSEDDLDERLDEILDKRAIYQFNAMAIERLQPNERAVVGAAEALESALRGVVSVPALTRLHAELPTLDSWLTAQLRVLAARRDEIAAELPDVGPWTLRDPEIPAQIALVLVRTLTACACLLALARAVEAGRTLNAAVGEAMVARIVSGARSHLQLLAAVPEARVPPSLVPAPLDLAAIAAEHQLHRRRAARLALEDSQGS